MEIVTLRAKLRRSVL